MAKNKKQYHNEEIDRYSGMIGYYFSSAFKGYNKDEVAVYVTAIKKKYEELQNKYETLNQAVLEKKREEAQSDAIQPLEEAAGLAEKNSLEQKLPADLEKENARLRTKLERLNVNLKQEEQAKDLLHALTNNKDTTESIEVVKQIDTVITKLNIVENKCTQDETADTNARSSDVPDKEKSEQSALPQEPVPINGDAADSKIHDVHTFEEQEAAAHFEIAPYERKEGAVEQQETESCMNSEPVYGEKEISDAQESFEERSDKNAETQSVVHKAEDKGTNATISLQQLNLEAKQQEQSSKIAEKVLQLSAYDDLFNTVEEYIASDMENANDDMEYALTEKPDAEDYNPFVNHNTPFLMQKARPNAKASDEETVRVEEIQFISVHHMEKVNSMAVGQSQRSVNTLFDKDFDELFRESRRMESNGDAEDDMDYKINNDSEISGFAI